MKKMAPCCTLIVALMVTVTVFAPLIGEGTETYEEPDIDNDNSFVIGHLQYYIMGPNAVMIDHVIGYPEDIKIPSTVEDGNGTKYNVVCIGGSSFEDCISLRSVTIPDTIKTINSSAFKNCTSLESVKIPASVETIGTRVFGNCTSLEKIEIDKNNPKYCSLDGVMFSKDMTLLIQCPGGKTGNYIIPNEVKKIENSAFGGCASLKSLNIHKGVLTIGGSVFEGCASLVEIVVDVENPNYSSDNGILFDKNQEKLMKYPAKIAGDSYTIPSGVKSISEYGFSDCTSLKSVNFENVLSTLTSIGRYAFFGCSNLANITMPDNVDSISDYMFKNCTGLTSVGMSNIKFIGGFAFSGCILLKEIEIPASVTYIANATFENCTALESVKIPDSVKSLGESAFIGCTALKEIKLPSELTTISPYAFEGCALLTSISIPASVTYIGESAFIGCISLNDIKIEEENSKYFSYDGALFDKKEKKLIVCPEGKTEAYEIPDVITSIGDYGFSGCMKLTSIIIPNSITEIGKYSFAGCTSLTSITIPGSVTSIGDFAFSACTSLIKIIVDEQNPNYSSEDGVLFNKDMTELIVYPEGKTGPYIISNKVKSIADYAFGDCTKLTSITIPNNVTSIGIYAFSGCTKLASITIPDSITVISNFAFEYCSLTSITIPASVKEIGVDAFRGNYSVKTITFEGRPDIIKEDAFNIGTYEHPANVTVYSEKNWAEKELTIKVFGAFTTVTFEDPEPGPEPGPEEKDNNTDVIVLAIIIAIVILFIFIGFGFVVLTSRKCE